MQSQFLPLVVLVLCTIYTYAVPVAQPAPFSLPLTRVESRSDLHPLIRRQLLANRAIRRFAHMTRRALPSDEFLSANLRNRILEVKNAGLELRDGSSQTDGNIGGPDSKNNVAIGNDPNTKNSLALDIQSNDVGYLFTLSIGSDPQNFLMLADTGSGDLWAPSKECGKKCGNHQILNEGSSFKSTGKKWKIKYGTGAVNGTLVKDDVTIAGLKLTQHPFGTADSVTDDFSSNDKAFDGIAGLSRSELSEQKNPTIIEALAKTKLVPSANMGYKLSRLDDKKNDGVITFGGFDESKFDKNEQVKLNNLDDGFWVANMDGASVDKKDVKCDDRPAILDTGTSLMLIPNEDAASIHKNIPGSAVLQQGVFSVPCDTKAVVSLKFGGKFFDIDPRDIALQDEPVDNEKKNCLSGIMGQETGKGGAWLVGDVFLKNVYLGTNVDKNEITLAKLV